MDQGLPKNINEEKCEIYFKNINYYKSKYKIQSKEVMGLFLKRGRKSKILKWFLWKLSLD